MHEGNLEDAEAHLEQAIAVRRGIEHDEHGRAVDNLNPGLVCALRANPSIGETH